MADLKESHLFTSTQQQQNHWYYCHKITLIHRWMQMAMKPTECSRGASIRALDIGAGNGIFSTTMKNLHGTPIIWDQVDSCYTDEDLGELCEQSVNRYRKIPEERIYDVILAIDVLEHVDDDKAFLAMLKSHLSERGRLIICVPAHQWLWSRHDDFLEHRRRYNFKSLTWALNAVGMTTERKSYSYILILPLAAFLRVCSRLTGTDSRAGSDLRIYPKAINQLLTWLMMVERRLLQLLPGLGLIGGLSCLAVATRSTHQPGREA